MLTRCYCGGGAGKAAQGQQLFTQAAQQQQLTDINNQFAGYTPDFYKNAQQQYVQAQLPQLNQQYQQAQDQTKFGLANRGLQQSSAGEHLGDQLSGQFAVAQQGVADAGQQYSNQLQTQIENYRAQLQNQVMQGGNPGSTNMGTISSAANISMPSITGAATNAAGNFANQYLMANMASNNSNYFPSTGGQLNPGNVNSNWTLAG